MRFDIVMDTNVLVAALKSSRGASFRLLSLVEHGIFTLHIDSARLGIRGGSKAWHYFTIG